MEKEVDMRTLLSSVAGTIARAIVAALGGWLLKRGVELPEGSTEAISGVVLVLLVLLWGAWNKIMAEASRMVAEKKLNVALAMPVGATPEQVDVLVKSGIPATAVAEKAAEGLPPADIVADTVAGVIGSVVKPAS